MSDDIVRQFSVDMQSREIDGLIVTWGEVSSPESTGGDLWTFADPELMLPIDPSMAELILDHGGHEVGHATRLTKREDGLYGRFAIDATPAGDAALEDIDSGRRRGLSMEVGGPSSCSCPSGAARNSRARCSCAPDPAMRLVRVALVRNPAFRSARVLDSTDLAFEHQTAAAFSDATVTDVAAQRNGATGMGDENKDVDKGKDNGTKATVLDTPDAGMERFTSELEARFAKLTEHVEQSAQVTSDAIAKAVGDAVTAAFGRLEDTNAGGRGAEAAARIKVISEPPVYRFDGDVSAPSLVRDAWAFHIDRDYDARDRLRKFQEQQQDIVKFATVTTSSASQVIPPGYRPDLYVTQLMQGRPLVSLASRGTISDATPFTVPRFVSATGATNDHTQGVNPTDGTLALDTVTVTPGAISGLFKLTREIIDAANPAIDAIAMQAMRESWNRQTEQKAYAALNINTNVGVNIGQPVASFDGKLAITNARSLLAQYPFTRFAAPNGAAIGQLVTTGFATAVDTTGRPLLPSIGAQNTAGVGNAVQQGWYVDGLPFVPAWAITGNVGDELALIMNSSDWWVWESPLLTFRFEERSGPALVELALFGYYAVQVLRPAGIFSIRGT